MTHDDHRKPEVRWKAGNAQQAVRDIRIEGRNARNNVRLLYDLAAELEDILRDLLPQAIIIMVEVMQPGYSGTGVVKVQPILEEGVGHKVVVKFGELRKIGQEYGNYQRYVHNFIGGVHSTRMDGSVFKKNLGGILYTFLGSEIDHMQSLREFYKHANISQINRSLDNLFYKTCRLWYANRTSFQILNLTEIYQQQIAPLPRIKNIVYRHQHIVRGQQTLTFNDLENTSTPSFVNPFYALKDMQPFVCTSYMSTLHGDLNPENVFLNQHGDTYLIDFQKTGPSHILRDVAALDTVIRIQLLDKETTLVERLSMEEALCSIDHFSRIEQLTNKLSTTNNLALAKAFDTVLHLRTIARKLIEQKGEDDMQEYYVALFYTTLNTLRFALKPIQFEHALLSASLLVDHLPRIKK